MLENTPPEPSGDNPENITTSAAREPTPEERAPRVEPPIPPDKAPEPDPGPQTLRAYVHEQLRQPCRSRAACEAKSHEILLALAAAIDALGGR